MSRPLAGAWPKLVFCLLPLAGWGCSTSTVDTIDTKAVMEKASGGTRQARQSAKAKEADAKAAKANPKLY